MAISLIVVSSGIILYCITQKKKALFLPIFLFFTIGYLSIQLWVSPKLPPNHVIHFTDSHRFKITGVVIDNPIKKKNRLKFILKIHTLERQGKNNRVMGRIKITVFKNLPMLSPGDKISFSSYIKSIRNFNNPGGFDYKRYMAFKNVWGSAYTPGDKLLIVERYADKGILNKIEKKRNSIASLIDSVGPGLENQILKALVVGKREGVSDSLRQVFNRTGVSHLLAISGLHVGIVAALAFFLFQQIFSSFKPLLLNALVKQFAALFSIFPVLAYGLIAGMSPSTQRAVIMVIIFLLAIIFEKDHDPLNTMAVAAMFILILHPPALFSVSFQLSFIAVASIIYGHSKTLPLESNKEKIGIKKIGQKLLSMLTVSIFAFLGTMPIVMFYFNQISVIGILVNLFAIPIIGFIVVPLGLLSVFVYFFTVKGALLIIKLCSLILAQVLKILSFLASIDFVAIKTITPTIFEIGCYYLLAWALLNIYDRSKKTHSQRLANELAKLKKIKNLFAPGNLFIIITTIIVIALAMDIAYWTRYRFFRDNLQITFIDVGQGNSALLEAPGGKTYLIDGGGFSDNSIFDIGKAVIAPLLWRKKIKTIDTVILSHPNSDHLNGLLYILKNFNVKQILTNGQKANTMAYEEFLDIVKKKKIDMPDFRLFYQGARKNRLLFKILHPPFNFLSLSKKDHYRDTNNNSLVLKVEFDDVSFLFPGDIQAKAEKEIVAALGDELESTILLAPHHGSKTSSTEPFLSRVNPKLVVVSSGWLNRFHFPHSSVMKRYKDRNYEILNVAKNGAVSIITDGKTFNAKPLF